MSPVPAFFETRSEARGKRSGRLVVSSRDINPHARHPDMEPTGAERPLLYVLGEAPGETEDLAGEQFIGKAGRLLRDHLSRVGLLKKTRFDNACRTRPPKNRTPFPEDVELYRSRIEESIQAARPKIIIGTGAVPLRWMLGGSEFNITTCRGRFFPVTIGSLRTWFLPILHPSYILRIKDQKKGKRAAAGSEIAKLFGRDIDAALDLLENYEEPEVLGSSEKERYEGVELLFSERQVVKSLRAFHGKRCAFDIETTALKPYAKDARVLSMAIARKGHTIAFEMTEGVKPAVRAWLESPGRKVAHVSDFELEWMVSLFGPEIAWKIALGDTKVDAYCLDERPGGFSLDFLSRQWLGLALKKQSTVDRKKMSQENVEVLLRYNALDAKYTYELDLRQRAELKRQGLVGISSEYMRRIPAAVLTQWRGLRVSRKRTERFQKTLQASIDAIQARITKLPDVVAFRKKRGRFSPTSGPDCIEIFKHLGYAEQLQGFSGKDSSDETALTKIKHPLAQAIMDLRSVTKLKGTYVDRLHPDHARSYIYADGLLHPEINVLGAYSGRSASSNPNEQNFPKRKHAEIRSQIIAGKDRLMVASDQGQIEARVIAALSGDSFFCQAIKDNYDIHLEWAERIAKLYPKTYKARGSNIKKFRSEVKNEFVFPLFYGTTAAHVGMMLDLPRNVAERLFGEFWERFPGVRRWQQELVRGYYELGYVEGPTGRRARAPKNENQIINTPVQGAAFDIVASAWSRLTRRACESGNLDLIPVLQVHDDLTFSVHKDHLDEVVEIIVDEMLDCRYEWMTVPLSVEVAVGPDWFNLEEIGTFT